MRSEIENGDSEERESAGRYYVCYRRDPETEKMEGYGRSKQLYDKCRGFSSKDNAARFAASNLPSVCFREFPVEEGDAGTIAASDKPYVVAGRFDGKYGHECYDGSTDRYITYDVIRCGEGTVRAEIEKMSRAKHVTKVLAGIGIDLLTGSLEISSYATP